MEEQPILNNLIDTTRIKDLSENTNNGLIVGTVSSIAGKFGKARDFPGSVGNYINVLDDPSLDLATTTFSVAAIIKVDSLATARDILSKMGTGPNGWLFRVLANGTLNFEIWNAGAQRDISSTSSGVITTGSIFHVEVVWDSPIGQLYVNGQPIATTVSGTPTQPGTNTNPLRVGGRADFAGNEMDGIIDEPALYNIAQTASEAEDLFDRGSPFLIPKSKVSSFSLIEADEDLLDLSTLRVFNSGG